MAYLDEYRKKKLLNSLVRGNLVEVIEAYENYPECQELRIPRTGDTALHVAVSDEWEDYVERMVKAAEDGVLEMGNGQGDTALHLAAKFGNAYLCKLFAERDDCLVGARNDFGETPLFCAVSRGKTKAFLYLHHFCKEKGCLHYGSYTRNNGNTILHSAISGQHFDLAYIIIQLYPELVHSLNDDRLSALHLLATKSSAFPSGVHLSAFYKFVYHCVRVEKLEDKSDLFEALADPQPQTSWKNQLKRPKLLDKLEFPEDGSSKKRVGHAEIDQQDEEAANKQVYHKGNLQRDETTDKGSEDGMGCICGTLWILLFLLCFAVYYPFRLLRFPFKLAKYIIGYEEYGRVKHIKERCIWSGEVMNKLITPSYSSSFRYASEEGVMHSEPPNEEDKHTKERCIFSPAGMSEGVIIPYNSKYSKEQRRKQKKAESPILVAARHGISEMVSCILDVNPGSIHDVNAENKNVVMLAVEHRHPILYEDLVTNWNFKKSIFGQVDTAGNSLLHLAAKLEDGKQFWYIRGAALHMQMEIKWYKFIKKSMPPRFFARYNNDRQTSKEIFRQSHQNLIEEGRQWLTSTSQSCSVVAALIATVAFATSTTVPGGLKQDVGVPSLEHNFFFIVSAISSLVALTSSMISVVMFLGILTSNFKLKNFRKDLPYKLLLGLLSLLISIVSMFISFYAGHYFVLKQEFNFCAASVYVLLCLPLVVFIILKFPLDFKVVWTTLLKKPQK